jgi:hypothetical protein
VALAARGARQTGPEVEKIADAAELAQVRRQARRVHIKSFLSALALTALALLIPPP